MRNLGGGGFSELGQWADLWARFIVRGFRGAVLPQSPATAHDVIGEQKQIFNISNTTMKNRFSIEWINYHEDRPSGSVSVRFYDAALLSGLSGVFTLKLEEFCQDEYVSGCKEDCIFGPKFAVVFVHFDLHIFQRMDDVQRS